MATITPTISNPFSSLSPFIPLKPLIPLSLHPFPPKPKPISLSSSPPPPLLLSPPLQSHSPIPLSQQEHQLHQSHGQSPPTQLHLHRYLRLAILHHDLSLGKSIHALVTKNQDGDSGYEDTRLHNSLVHMYVKLGRLIDARKTLDAMLYPDVVSYSCLISAYGKCGSEEEALGLFREMRESGIYPNEFSLVAVLTNCLRQSNLELGHQLHALVIKMSQMECTHVGNALMGVYVRCSYVDDAVRVFDGMPSRDVSSWNAVFLGMVKDERYDQAFELFHGMQMGGTYGDRFSLSTLLTAASECLDQMQGEAIHGYALKIGLELDLSVGNALIGYYTKCGLIEDVVSVFQGMPTKDVFTWTEMLIGYMEFGMVESGMEVFNEMPERNHISYDALLAGFCQNGEGFRGLKLFQEIMEDGIEISDFTIIGIMHACAIVCDRRTSEQIHAVVVKIGCVSNAWIRATLLDMCAKCDRMEDAKKMFEQWTHAKSFSIAWTSLVCAHARNEQPDEAMNLFTTILKREDMVMMDEITLATIIGVCGALGCHDMGKQMQAFAIRSGCLSDLGVGNAIVSMYAKCGNMEDAIRFFNSMTVRNTVSWNALISAHLLHRQGSEALAVWGDMERLSVKPDSITFLLILSACRYTDSNSVDTCQRVFLKMTSFYGIKPVTEHYAAMVNVFGYWSCFDEAEELIKSMPFKPDASIWRTLLNSCKLRSNVSLERQTVQRLLELEPEDPSTYILVSNLYSASGRWHCSEKIREQMQKRGFKKHPARSWMIHQSTFHSFHARDSSHPQSKDIRSALEILILECTKAGYELDTSFVLHEVEEYQKKDFLFYHSAKLAVVYGLLVTGLEQPVRVVKNIRLCGDCHTFFKFVSSSTGREILLRDATGFHHFKQGRCSCADYW